MQGYAEAANKECLFHLLDIAKKAAQSNTTEQNDEPDETISDKDSKMDKEKIDLNTVEIRNIYVSLVLCERIDFIITFCMYIKEF